MHEFYYDCIKNRYAKNSILWFTGTDSLMHKIEMDDVYEDFNNEKEMFDFSNYSIASKYYGDSNNLVVVKMKDLKNFSDQSQRCNPFW